MTTKQKILSEALSLFSEKGYSAVFVGDIAEAVGIKAPSLYKHYKSKQAIFDAILDEMKQRYDEKASALQMNGSDAARDADVFSDISEDTLVQMGTGLFLHFLHDEYVCKFRKMLMNEHHSNKELAALYAKRYVDEPISYQTMLFGMLTDAGILISENPQIMAIHFYTPIFTLLTLCDCHPEREQEAVELIEQHIRQFNRLYKKPSEESQ